MATVATRQEETNVSNQETRIHLTPTGLLMEGVSASLRFPFAFLKVNE